MHSQLEAHATELARIMEKNERVVILAADLMTSSKLSPLEAKFPDRALNIGIAEQNMTSIAAGLAHEGLLPFTHTFATFASMRSCEQVRSDIFYTGLNVKVVGTHAGMSTGPAGPTHYAIEDIGLIRVMPQSAIVVPADATAARKAVRALVKLERPVYLRLDRNPLPDIYTDDFDFQFGKGYVLQDGADLVIFATGTMVKTALDAADALRSDLQLQAAVIDIHTIKPIDEVLVQEYTAKCSACITIEEHNITGGLGSAVAEVMSASGVPCRLKRLGIQEYYPKGGPLMTNRQRTGLTAENILKTAKEFL